jgi:NodT family efflux transporter outer membrane factor (OMF) lipoprotein
VKHPRNMILVDNPRRAPWLAVLLALAALPFTGCVVGPKYHTPAVPAPPAYKEVGDWKPAQPNDQNLGGEWWKIFQDPQLDALELQVNVSNQNLKAAEAQYQQARAALRYNRADYYPTLTAGLSGTRTGVSAHRPPPSSIFDGITYNDFVLPFTLSYQADVWGRVRKTVESYREQAQASAADLATVNLTMHADLAVDYFQARSLDAEEQLLNSTVKQYEQALELNQSRFDGGIASEVEVEQAKTQLQTTRAAAIDVGVLRAQYEHAVAILIGKPPAEFSLPPLPLTTPPPHIPVSVPSDLLERRPDIAAAERRVAAANAQIGVAKSAYYPLVNLTGSGGFESSVITTLFTGPSGLWSVGLSAVGTVFDVGRRRALNDQARAAYDFQVAAYRENVLTGFQQVEDNLAAVRILENEAQVQDEAVAAAQRSLDLSITRYKGGVELPGSDHRANCRPLR